MPIELQMLGLAGLLVLVQAILGAMPRTLSSGLGWAAGPRDEGPAAVSPRAARLERAYRNLLETFPVFAAATVAVVVAEVTSPMTALGSVLYVAARVAYVPAYVVHVPLLRSLIWVAAMVGVVLVLLPLVGLGR